MPETLNALCVLMVLLGLAAVVAGWLIIVFSSLFQLRWIDFLLCCLCLPAPVVAWQRRHYHAFWMLSSGIVLLILGFAGAALRH